MFADDLKLYPTHVSNDDKTQCDISNVEKWSSAWQLRLNNEKCHFMQLGRKKSDQTNYYLTDAAINSFVPISRVSHVKDLGVYIDENLNFEKQVAECTKKANGILASIKRTIKFINGDTFKLLCHFVTLSGNTLSTTPVHPTTIGTIAISLSCHNAFNSIPRFWYFSTFSIRLSTTLSSLGTAMSITKQFCLFCS